MLRCVLFKAEIKHFLPINRLNLFLKLAKTDGNVFATDSIIAALMCCSRSVYPWDIVVTVIKQNYSNFNNQSMNNLIRNYIIYIFFEI